MNPLPALIDAIDAADLPIAVYRTAVRLARLTDDQGRLVLEWNEFQQMTGCHHADAARRHLRAMREAGLISWRGGITVVVFWIVSRQLVSENAQQLRVDNNSNGHYHEENRQLVSEVRPRESARKRWFEPRQTVRVSKKTASVWKQAATVSHSHTRFVCLFDPIPNPVDEKDQTNKQSRRPARDELAMARELLEEVGVTSGVAKELAPLGFDLVRRAVAAWWTQRKEVGGKLENHPGVVVYWLKNPGKRALGPNLPKEWVYSDIGEKYTTDAERQRYTVSFLEPDPPQPPESLPSQAPPPMPSNGPWENCLKELRLALPGGFVPTLEGSRIEEAGMVNRDGNAVPLYHVLIAPNRVNSGLDYFVKQAKNEIRKRLSSVLGYTIAIEIVAAQPVPEPEPTAP